ncbi:MAG: hypothetical protein IPN17_27080 [Deltaproteobacteria bacterium]|nr:hypothetical protein [Deltaproteobacteria bacterium]
MLRAGAKVLVFPGGDADSLRPWSARRELRFEGRQGYARLAMETGAPIVPVVTAGAHESFVVLRQGLGLARAVGVTKWLRFRSFPVTLAFRGALRGARGVPAVRPAARQGHRGVRRGDRVDRAPRRGVAIGRGGVGDGRAAAGALRRAALARGGVSDALMTGGYDGSSLSAPSGAASRARRSDSS